MWLHAKQIADPKVRSAVITKAFIRAVHRLDFKSKEIVHLTGMSAAVWSRVLHHHRLIEAQTKEAELSLLFLRIYRSLDALYDGNVERMKEWLRADNNHLQGIPAELIQKIEGLARVAAYLDAMRGLA